MAGGAAPRPPADKPRDGSPPAPERCAAPERRTAYIVLRDDLSHGKKRAADEAPTEDTMAEPGADQAGRRRAVGERADPGALPRRPAFLFDLDGTLVDSVYQHVLAWREAMAGVG